MFIYNSLPYPGLRMCMPSTISDWSWLVDAVSHGTPGGQWRPGRAQMPTSYRQRSAENFNRLESLLCTAFYLVRLTPPEVRKVFILWLRSGKRHICLTPSNR